jgi:hypothetical protein
MHETFSLDVVWWITVVELPALAGLFWLVWRGRRESADSLTDARHDYEMALGHLRETLSAYKLEVAKSYVSIPYLKEVERRLTGHLIRIEDKLDGVKGGRP